MRAMRKPLILTAIKNYADGNPVRLHMPGHKGSAEFSATFPGAELDITELSFSGCLTSGEGIVAEAEIAIAEILGARRSHMVTDGSSASILAMLYVLSKRGNKVIIPRNSHKSVYNALKLFNLSPLFLECEEREGIVHQRVESAEDMLAEEGVSGLLLVSPDYFGQVPNLALARELTERYGKILAVDGAHGGHLKFTSPSLYAGSYADIWVDGVHKTLPCLTQASLLNVNDAGLLEDVAEGLSLLRTTSPSYPIMASIEYGVYFAEAEGEERFNALFTTIEEMSKRFEAIECKLVWPDDKAKLLLDCHASGIDVKGLTSHLEERGIFCEMADDRYVVFMVSLSTVAGDLQRLYSAIAAWKENNKKVAQNTQKTPLNEYRTQRALPYAQATALPAEYVTKEKAAGRIAAENVGFFPPCYPIVTAGEVLNDKAVCALAKAENTFGLKGGLFKVVKERK